MRVRTIKRRPPEERSNSALMNALEWSPWMRMPGRLDDVEIPVVVVVCSRTAWTKPRVYRQDATPLR